jgi:hypothetical protein
MLESSADCSAGLSLLYSGEISGLVRRHDQAGTALQGRQQINGEASELRRNANTHPSSLSFFGLLLPFGLAIARRQ